MWVYEKKLQYPVKIKNCNPRLPNTSSRSTADQTANWQLRSGT